MKRKFSIIFEATLLSIAVLVIAGCQFSPQARKASSIVLSKTGSIYTLCGEDVSLAGYETARIDGIENNVVQGKEQAEMCSLLYEDIVKRLEKSKLFKKVCRNASPESAGKTLLIEGRLIDYVKGSRFKRMATLGGAGFIVVRFTFKDAESAQTLAEINARAFVRDGLIFGGSIRDAVSVTNKGAVNFIKKRAK